MKYFFDNIQKYGIKEFKDQLTFEILKEKFPWVLKAKIKNAVLGIERGLLFWYEGIWINGTWKNGIWNNGHWYNGEWDDGIWINGVWSSGIWRGGKWKSGICLNVESCIQVKNIKEETFKFVQI